MLAKRVIMESLARKANEVASVFSPVCMLKVATPDFL